MKISNRYNLDFEPDESFAFDCAPIEGLSFLDLPELDNPGFMKRVDRGEPAQSLDFIEDREKFSALFNERVGKAVLIKECGSIKHSLPGLYEQFFESVKRIADYQARHDPYFLYRQCYLSIRQRHIKKGMAQVSTKWHQDQAFRKVPRNDTKPLLDHGYVIADHAPTLFQARPIENACEVLNTLTNCFNAQMYRQAEPYQISHMSGLSFHNTGIMQEEGVRTFIRVGYLSPKIRELAALSMQQRKNMPQSLKAFL